MFRSELKEKLKDIFGFKKVTFSAPSESFEQDTLFVEIESANTRPSKGKKVYAKVSGNLVVFSHGAKLPFGFFSKRIEQADAELTSNFFFFDLDQNALNSPARLQDISEIRGKFVFLYSAEYDPNQGSLTSLSLGDE